VDPATYQPSPWSGVLSYTVCASQCGSATYDVVATDDGVMIKGPSPLAPATSATHSFTITVNCPNSPPQFTNAADPAPVLPSASPVPVAIAGWAAQAGGISPSTPAGLLGEANQRLAFK